MRQPSGAPEADETGQLLVNVLNDGYSGHVPGIHLRVTGGEHELTAVTNGCGYAMFDDLPVGHYSIHEERKGTDFSVRAVSVPQGDLTIVNLQGPPFPPKVSPGCTPAKYKSGPAPDQWVNGKRIDGCLVLVCVITAEGAVRECKATEPLEGLTEPTIETLMERRYIPAVCSGKPTDANFTFRIRFGIPH